ncbi:MAG: CIA30 family protein [Treponema sp.]|jgi:hypothetical protein|nr:CIA30 family protein [Treponema sp.]
MKKTQNVLILLSCVMFCVFTFSCASSGGGEKASAPAGGEAATVLYKGTLEAYTDVNDKGDSTIELEEFEKDGTVAFKVTGNVTTAFQYGFVGWQFSPDEETLESLKAAKAISFKFVGDGQRQTVKYRISSVTDHAHYEFHFGGDAGKEEYVEVPIKSFQQPSWGNFKRMNQANVEDICWQTHESWRPGTFEITIWDVRIHL